MGKLKVTSSPHLRAITSTRMIMLDVILALLPAAIMGCIIYGIRALLVLLACVCFSVLSEQIFCLIAKKKQTVGDLSAVVTGLILGLNLRASAPIWQCLVGSVIAIVIVKCLFGGLGCNFANPAATARVVMLLCFAGTIGGGSAPVFSATGEVELVSGATPLSAMKAGLELPGFWDMIVGTRGGAIGESCMIAIAIGFIYLVARRVIKFETPLIYIATVFILSLISGAGFGGAFYQVVSGGVVFASVFMITDYVTTPITRSGKMIFALGCGIITFLIRKFGSYPEGASFSIVIMNIVSPYIEKLTAKIPLGRKSRKEASGK